MVDPLVIPSLAGHHGHHPQLGEEPGQNLDHKKVMNYPNFVLEVQFLRPTHTSLQVAGCSDSDGKVVPPDLVQRAGKAEFSFPMLIELSA